LALGGEGRYIYRKKATGVSLVPGEMVTVTRIDRSPTHCYIAINSLKINDIFAHFCNAI
jgi:hypothetical protein